MTDSFARRLQSLYLTFLFVPMVERILDDSQAERGQRAELKRFWQFMCRVVFSTITIKPRHGGKMVVCCKAENKLRDIFGGEIDLLLNADFIDTFLVNSHLGCDTTEALRLCELLEVLNAFYFNEHSKFRVTQQQLFEGVGVCKPKDASWLIELLTQEFDFRILAAGDRKH